MKVRTRIATAALAAITSIASMVVLAPAAEARRVQTAGPVAFTFASGSLKVGNQVSDTGEGDPITFSGTIATNGNVLIPASNITFPPIPVEAGGYNVLVRIIPTQDATGNLNPVTGVATMQVRFYVKIDGVPAGAGCSIGTPGAPMTLNLTTGTSGSQTGALYNPTTGMLTLADGLFAVPASSNCGIAGGTLDSELGLPSPSGNNYAVLTASASPPPQPGVVARFIANPSSGVAPLNVSFDASTSTVLTPSATYRWDFTNDGSFEVTSATPTGASFIYAVPATYTARLQVTDSDGDVSVTTRQIIVNAPTPDAAITKSSVSPPFVTGVTEEYAISVTNTGTLATSGTTTVVDTLPAGMTYGGFTGSGWSCTETSGTVTCDYAASLAIAETAPELQIQVVAGEPAVGFATNSATVSTADDPNASNNTAQDTTEVIRAGIDLTIHKAHDPVDSLLRGRRATYEINVQNAGTQPTTGRVTVLDTLPDGVTFVSASGPGWTCNTTALPLVRCFTDDIVAPDATLPTLRIRVDVDTDAPDELDNTATVQTGGDTGAANDSSTDEGFVRGFAADYNITKTHAGTFLAGEPGNYNITVRNVGTQTAGNTVTVTDTLPDGLTPVSAAGVGNSGPNQWSCTITGQEVECTHAGPVEPENSLEPINISVAVGDAAVGGVTNIAEVSSVDDNNGDNNVATDPTDVRSPLPDLAIDKSHSATRFTTGTNGTYDIAVSNPGSEPSRGTITITDVLPAGLTYVSATGTDWTCGAVGQTVTCTRTTRINPGVTSHITLTVGVGAAAVPGVTNTASVSVVNDTNSLNDFDADPTLVVLAPIATKIEADGAILSLFLKKLANPLLGLGVETRYGIDGLQARITTADGTPLANKRLRFTMKDGTGLCEGFSNANGEVKCGQVLISALQATLSNPYRVTFAGDDAYTPSQGLGPILILAGIRI